MTNTEQIKKELKRVYQSGSIRRVLKWCVIILIALVIFQAGQFVGLKRAEFSFRMADNYYNNFDFRTDKRFEGRKGEPRVQTFTPGMMGSGGMMGGNNFTESHGAAGKIIKISLPTITVSSLDNVEKTILINKDTVIREFRSSIDSSELKVDDFVVSVGEPTDNGQIEAKFIRVMPFPNPMTGNQNQNINGTSSSFLNSTPAGK